MIEGRTHILLAVGLLAGVLLGGAVLGGAFGFLDSTPDEESPSATPTPMETAMPMTPTLTPDASVHPGYNLTEVHIVDAETDERKGMVYAAIANNASRRYTGLSETDRLPGHHGMVFPYASEQELTFVMRNMSFGIDIVYVGANQTITTIHHAPAPGPGEDGNDQRYPGTGQYVLEVNLRWTADRDITTGDRVTFSRVS